MKRMKTKEYTHHRFIWTKKYKFDYFFRGKSIDFLKTYKTVLSYTKGPDIYVTNTLLWDTLALENRTAKQITKSYKKNIKRLFDAVIRINYLIVMTFKIHFSVDKKEKRIENDLDFSAFDSRRKCSIA